MIAARFEARCRRALRQRREFVEGPSSSLLIGLHRTDTTVRERSKSPRWFFRGVPWTGHSLRCDLEVRRAEPESLHLKRRKRPRYPGFLQLREHVLLESQEAHTSRLDACVRRIALEEVEGQAVLQIHRASAISFFVYIPGSFMPANFRAKLAFPICLNIFRICAYWRNRLLTSCTLVPEPRAMRLRRLPFITSWCRRS